ncbi:MAG: hypothetical protein U0271_04010 [Polyangiaceae bacterium]
MFGTPAFLRAPLSRLLGVVVFAAVMLFGLALHAETESSDLLDCRAIHQELNANKGANWEDARRYCRLLDKNPVGIATQRTSDGTADLSEQPPKLVRQARFCKNLPPPGTDAQPTEAACRSECEQFLKGAIPSVSCYRLTNQGAAPMPMTIATILLGATDFFIGRAKAELEQFLYSQVADDLCPAASGFLPNTCKALQSPATDIQTFQLAAVTSTFRADLDAFPVNVVKFALSNTPRTSDAVKCILPLFAAAAADIFISKRIDSSTVSLLNPASARAPAECKKILKNDEVVSLLEDLVELLGEGTSLYSKDASGNTSETAGLDRAKALLFQLVSDYKVPAAQAESLQDVVLTWIQLVLRSTKDGESFANRQLVVATIGLLEQTTQLLWHLRVDASPETGDSVGRGEQLQANLQALLGFATAAAQGDWVVGVVRVLAMPLLADALHADPKLQMVAKHLQLLAGLATARTAEEVEKLLESAAAPIGSYREFRRRLGAGFISAMVGISPGVEVSLDDASASATLAVSLPVGFEVGLGRLGPQSSVQLFLVALNLGSIATVRLDGATEQGDDGQAKTVPEPTFQAVLTPGFFFVFGIADTPLAIAAGAEFAPFGREEFDCSAGTSCAVERNVPAVRIQALISVDLPFLPLF